uniref:Uncharacterized protein n=1 Tax=Arundo donax TaxID=35708 RepID=A0A0A8Z3F6_ARUDO
MQPLWLSIFQGLASFDAR